jgi:hypothetical protein
LRRFRSATAQQRILPSFLVLGAQRAGTSTLFFHLRQHPEISGPRGAEKSVDWPKELHFFDEKFGKGVDWYRAFFPLEASRSLARRRGRDRIAGEATPNYLFHPQAPPRAAEVLSGGRLIALLRDPSTERWAPSSRSASPSPTGGSHACSAVTSAGTT